MPLFLWLSIRQLFQDKMQPCILAESRKTGHQTHKIEPLLGGFLKQPTELVLDRHDPAKIVAPWAMPAKTQTEWRAKRHADRSFSAWGP